MKQVMLPPPQAWTFARLPILVRELALPTQAVVHIGAHHGEEVGIYRACGYQRIALVEPDPDQVAILTERFGVSDDVTIHAVAAVPGGPPTVTLYRSERTVHSSLLTGDGASISVPARLMPDLQGEANLLVLDAQGLELELLRATSLSRPELACVIVETTRRPGDTAGNYQAVCDYMAEWGYLGVEEWVHDQSGYTDSVFVAGHTYKG